MSLPVPLMFVNGPPVYEKVPMMDEESTSLFVKYFEEEPLFLEEPVKELVEIDPVIRGKLARVQSSFGQQIYKELTFVLPNEEIVGNVTKYDDNTIHIELLGTEDMIMAIELSDILDIRWRGKSLPKN